MTEMKTGGRISQVLGKATSDIVALLRQEIMRGGGQELRSIERRSDRCLPGGVLRKHRSSRLLRDLHATLLGSTYHGWNMGVYFHSCRGLFSRSGTAVYG
jgi:hypothetical protein